jgi:hypothetical protein
MILSCKKDELKPLFSKGVIKGKVSIFSEYTDSSIFVEITGPYNSKKEKIFKNPNSNLYEYSFGGLGNGTYKITASKDSFGKVDCYNIQTLGNDTIWACYIQLYKVPLILVTPAEPVYSSQDQSYFYFNNAPVNYKVGYKVFMSTSNNVAYNKYLVKDEVESDGENKIRIRKNTSIFKAGTKVYFIIYPCNYSDYGYYNAFYNLTIFSTINPEKHSKIFSATIN